LQLRNILGNVLRGNLFCKKGFPVPFPKNFRRLLLSVQNKTLKIVDVYLVSSCLSATNTKKGACLIEMNYENYLKHFSIVREPTTSSRVLLDGLVEAVTKLKEPCYINIFIPTIAALNSPGSLNYDLVLKFHEIIKERGHIYKIKVTQKHISRMQSMCRSLLDVAPKYCRYASE